MRIDRLVMHADEVKPGDGAEFYGTPIHEASTTEGEVREERDMRKCIRLGLGVEATPIALLPGEVLKDNVIRRETTAEVIGEEFYTQQDGEEGITDLQAPDYWDDYTARCV
jgi:hypothetical protein